MVGGLDLAGGQPVENPVFKCFIIQNVLAFYHNSFAHCSIDYLEHKPAIKYILSACDKRA